MAEDIKLEQKDEVVVKPKYVDIDIPQTSETALQDVGGLLETVETAPSGKARRLIEQIKIVSGTVYVYDSGNDAWIVLGQETTYGGEVVNNAAAAPFPSGWSVSHPSTGNHTVTHNLGHTNYVVVAMPNTTTPRAISVTSLSTTAFNLNFKNSAGSDTDTDFHFIVKVEN